MLYKPVLDAVKVNLIIIEDIQDVIWEKVHLVDNTSLLPNELSQRVVTSVN